MDLGYFLKCRSEQKQAQIRLKFSLQEPKNIENDNNSILYSIFMIFVTKIELLFKLKNYFGIFGHF